MEKILLGVLLLTILSGGMTQVPPIDLRRIVFIFPEESASALVFLIPRMRKPVKNFTLYLEAFTDLTCPYSLFSYSTRSKDNELLLFVNKI
ncbi:serum amyloid P-component [Glossophaga mutica]